MASRLDRLISRRIDPDVTSAQLFNEVHRSLQHSEAVRYTVGAMQPIDPEYTKNTYLQGERVCNQLRNRLSNICDYEYQGSVTNDTHIKAKSDIDILVLIGLYYSLEPPQRPRNPYQGNPIQDLTKLREDAISSLTLAFPEATVDSSGSKSISIEGGSLTRKIDVVPSNWYDTQKYTETREKIYRGVQILDVRVPERLKNTPFLHNAWINRRDQATGGGLRKAARLMKSLKYDSDSINLSSYDLVSIAFNMPDAALTYPKGQELSILNSCLHFCLEMVKNPDFRNALYVPDVHRKIFAEGHATVQGLIALTEELQRLATDVLQENQRSFQVLAEARIDF